MLTDRSTLDLFGRVLAMPDTERDHFLAELQAQDSDRVHQVRTLLAAVARNQADGFLEAPVTGDSRLVNEVVALGLSGWKAAGDHTRPKTIGPFEVLRELGASLSSTVYLARQVQPVRRLAAVKLLAPGATTEIISRRFAAECEALASMQHSNVAQFFETSVHDGRPYVAMEYVDGRTITAYARIAQVAGEPLLRLFLQVCEGVAHAHQRGFIHRDLKPSNILVTESDAGRPAVKVIDFGIAKMQGPRLRLQETQAGVVMGTLAYTSPEQLRGDSAAVDTRSDVFSLGLLLLELLTQTPPYDEAEGLNGLAGAGDRRHFTRLFEQRGRGIPADLVSIIERATMYSPAERYESVRALANDVERYLAHQPVLARRRTWSYVVSRFVRRHRTMSATAAVILLVAGWAGTMVWRAKTERASLALEIADAWLREALHMGSSLGDTSRREPVVRRLLHQTEALNRRFPDDPRVMGMLASAHAEVGYALLARQDVATAMSHFEASQKIREVLAADPDAGPQAEFELSLAWVRTGDALVQWGRHEEGQALYAKALRRDRELAALHPTDATAVSNLGWSLNRVGVCQPERSERVKYAQEQAAVFERLESLRAGPEALIGQSTGWCNFANEKYQSGAPDPVAAAKALALSESACQLAPEDRFAVFARLRGLMAVADAEADPAQRVQKMSKAVDEAERLLRRDPQDQEAADLRLATLERALTTIPEDCADHDLAARRQELVVRTLAAKEARTATR